MKTHVLFLCIASGASLLSYAQDPNQSLYGKLTWKKAGDAMLSSELHIPCTGTVNVPSGDLSWKPGLYHKINESAPLERDPALLARIRAEALDRQKMNGQDKSMSGTAPSTLAVTPTIGVHYIANQANGWSPLDNHIAISDGGIIVSVANDTFDVYDSLGNSLYTNPLNTFINDNTIPNACDPQILYDRGADRFIFYCQEVTSTSGVPNEMLLFFSQTNNPATGGWNYFKLSGNPLNDGSNSNADYPKVGITDKDVYVSSNLFANPGGTFHTAIVWQIQKSTGYSGGTLNSKLWSNLTNSPFTVLPVSEGQGNAYGPGIWMVATNSSGASTIDLYQTSNDVTSSPTMTHYSVATTAYLAAAPVSEKGTSTTLDITDSRSLGGFYLNGIIHFTFNCQNAASHAEINYNRLNTATQTNTSLPYSVSGLDLAYPAVASYTASGVTGDQSVMIGYASSSSTTFPEMWVISCDNGGNYGTPTAVQTSASYVSGGSSSERWGDYSGMCRRHNSPQACCWMSGSYGNSSKTWEAYVAQIYDNSFVTNVAQLTQPVSTLKTFPNPVIDMFAVEFTTPQDENVVISVYDMQGRVVKQLYQGFCHEGENGFSFNKSNLSRGTYFLTIRTESNTLSRQKIIIAD